MCDKECGCCCEEEEVVGMTKEEIIADVLDEISEGACAGCMLGIMFDFAYDQGKQDLARESRDFYQDVLEEEV